MEDAAENFLRDYQCNDEDYIERGARDAFISSVLKFMPNIEEELPSDWHPELPLKHRVGLLVTSYAHDKNVFAAKHAPKQVNGTTVNVALSIFHEDDNRDEWSRMESVLNWIAQTNTRHEPKQADV